MENIIGGIDEPVQGRPYLVSVFAGIANGVALMFVGIQIAPKSKRTVAVVLFSFCLIWIALNLFIPLQSESPHARATLWTELLTYLVGSILGFFFFRPFNPGGSDPPMSAEEKLYIHQATIRMHRNFGVMSILVLIV